MHFILAEDEAHSLSNSGNVGLVPLLCFSPAALHHLLNGENFQQSPVTLTLVSEMFNQSMSIADRGSDYL